MNLGFHLKSPAVLVGVQRSRTNQIYLRNIGASLAVWWLTHFHCRGPRFDSQCRNQDPISFMAQEKKKKKKGRNVLHRSASAIVGGYLGKPHIHRAWCQELQAGTLGQELQLLSTSRISSSSALLFTSFSGLSQAHPYLVFLTKG